MKFHDAIKEFGGLQNTRYKATGYIQDLRAFCFYLKNPQLEKVSWRQIQHYTKELLEIGWTEYSLVRKYAALRKFFTFWYQKDQKYLNPVWIPVMHSQKWEPNFIDHENYQKLINVIPKETYDQKAIRNLALVNLLWDTQAKYSEILALDVRDINLRKKKARIKSINSEICWTDETNQNLRTWLVRRTTLKTRSTVSDREAVFISCNGRKVWKRFEDSGLSQMLWRYCKKARIAFFGPNSFRKPQSNANKEIIRSDVENILEYVKWSESFKSTKEYEISRSH